MPGRVYDSCSDKDCLEDLRVYFTERDQMVDRPCGQRPGEKSRRLLTTYIDVEALPFNRGYYSCDLTFFFEVQVECLFRSRRALHHRLRRRRVPETGDPVWQRGQVSRYSTANSVTTPRPPGDAVPAMLPRCSVQVAEPIVLSAQLMDACDRCNCGCACVLRLLLQLYSGPASATGTAGTSATTNDGKIVYVTIGIFTIVQLDPERSDAGAGIRLLCTEQGMQLPGQRQSL